MRPFSTFAKWLNFHRHYSLVQVEVFMSIGPSRKRWVWHIGKLTHADLNKHASNMGYAQTQLGPLTVHQYYVPREHTTTRPGERSAKTN